MILEKILFNGIAVGLFTILFLKLVKKNDTSYIGVLALSFIGIFINFIEILLGKQVEWFGKAIMYLFSVIIPAIVVWIESVRKVNFSELALLVQIKILTKMRNTEKAKEKMNHFLQKNANSYTIYHLLAQTYEKEGNNSAAISAYQKVVELKKSDLQSTYQLAKLLNQEKQSQEAICILQEVLKVKPENEKMSELLGNILVEQERYKEAVSVYMTALRYHPASYELYYDLGMTCTLLNDFQKAKEFYEKAASLNSLLYNAKLNLGQIALIYGDLEEAEKFFMEATKGEAVESGSYYYLSQIAMLKGDEEKAKNYMNVAIELDEKAYKQLQKDPVFLPIRNEIAPPKQEFEHEQETRKKELTAKERKASSHLSQTCLLVQSLSNEDLESFKRKTQKERSKQWQQKEKGQD